MQLANPFAQLNRSNGTQPWKALEQTERQLPEVRKGTRHIATLAQISDPHVCDAQSPLRASYFDRLSDPHHPLSSMLPGPLGGYRAQEALSTQVFEVMLRTLNRLEVSPLSGKPIDLLLLTGDLVDNMQRNELDWVSSLLAGRELAPNSGDKNHWQGPGSLEHYSAHYWNPDPTPQGQPDDSPCALYGFPKISGFWQSAMRQFSAQGAQIPWVAVQGNHDALIQGTIAASAATRRLSISDQLPIDFVSEPDALQFLSRFGPKGPASWPLPGQQIFEPTAADPTRSLVSQQTWQEFGFSPTTSNYWRLDLDQLVILGLDTCNPWGGWDGSVDLSQFEWLREQLRLSEGQRVLVVSHHPQNRLENDWSEQLDQPRVTGSAILEALNAHGRVLAWVAGHTHRNHISRLPNSQGRQILSIETSSLIDWPQQARIIELYETESGDSFVASSTLNHVGVSSPVNASSQLDDHPADGEQEQLFWLAGLSRQLAANDWQRQSGRYSIANLEGDAFARDCMLEL